MSRRTSLGMKLTGSIINFEYIVLGMVINILHSLNYIKSHMLKFPYLVDF